MLKSNIQHLKVELNVHFQILEESMTVRLAAKLSILLFTLLGSTETMANIKFSKDLPSDQKKLIESDLKNLDSLIFSDADKAGEKIFNTEMNSKNLKDWLFQRSRYIVSENFNFESSIKIINKSYQYPNDIMPQFERSTNPPPPRTGGKVTVVMSNVGAAAYIAGKEKKSLFGLDIPGQGVVKITSPRSGVFKVGEGLFLPILRDSYTQKTLSHSLKRLTTFFHEARHSDGNGKSLAFVHAVCPPDHQYAEYNACDRNTNGPYTIGALFLRSAVDSCSKCPEAEKEALRVQYTDSFSRILSEPLKVRDNEAQLSALDTIRETCESLANLKLDLSQFEACKNLDQANSSNNDEIEAPKVGDLDDKPEMGAN